MFQSIYIYHIQHETSVSKNEELSGIFLDIWHVNVMSSVMCAMPHFH